MKDLLQKTHLRALMLVVLMLCGVGTTWGEEKTITLDYSSFGLSNSYALKTATVDEIGFTVNQGYKGQNNVIQMNSSKGSGILYNTTAISGLKSITVNVANGDKTYTITTGTSQKPTTNSQTGTKSGTFNALSGDEYFQLKVSGASYFASIEITYEDNGDLTPSNLTLTGAPVALAFDLYNNATAQTISYTTSSTGAITVSESEYVTTSVSGNTITVTPVKITPSAQTITISQAADDTYDEGSATFTVTISNNDPNRLGGANNPYTVAQALENTPASGNSEDVYVKGMVSKFQAADIMSDGTNYRYYISDDGTTSNQLLVYKGKGLNDEAFSNADDLQIGDVVVVKGPLSTYNNTKEINSGNYIVSLNRKDIPTLLFGEDAYSVVKNGTQTINATSNSTGAITYQSSNTDIAEIDATTGVVTAKAAGTTTITATIAATEEYKSTTATVELTVTAPKHKVSFYQNGTKLSEAEVSEDEAITFPEAEAEIYGKSFVGWTTSAIDGTTETPELVNNPVMGTADVTYYAVYAIKAAGTLEMTTDELTNTLIGISGTSYSTWSGKEASSNAVYAGNSAGGNNAIQLRSNTNSGIVSTTSGGKASKITVVWNSNTTAGRTLDIYGSNTAYSAASNLYNTSTRGTKIGSITIGSSTELAFTDDYAYIGLRSNNGAMYLDNISITWENGTPATYSGYCTTVLPPVELAAPIIFHDGGEYEGALKVAMAGQGTIKYTLNGGAEQTYSAPINVSETTTITAWTESNGVKSDEVSKTFTITAATAGPAVEDNYYTIKNNGNNKYVNVAGRKTVTFVDETATAAGTVIRVKADDKGQVQILRSQGVDIPGYAEKAMNYVPKIVELIVDKLHAEGSGELLGENGLDAIMAKFKESFDYHLYLEEANGGYRIYGRTPSMQPVVDFYAENKANVDAKLPGLEAFINSAIEKVLQKTNGSGASILVPFSLQTVWEKMGSTLTEPVDEASTAKFYEEVLSSEANVWNFAYETAMIYWTKLKDHDKFKENLNKLGDYAKYIDKVENIRPNFKYYIVQKDNQLDFISQGNSELNAAFTTWTLAERTDFSVAFPEDNLLNGKYYTTLYTDFAYTLPEGVKAYKVTGIEESGCYGYAVTEEVGSQNIAAQTPVLLMSESAETQELTLAETGTTVTGNLLVGPDYLINTYKITAAQVESLFDMAKALLGEDGYNNYLKEYEHLMLRTAGTVNNKYFYGLSKDDCKNLDENVCLLGNSEEAGIGFANDWQTMNINQAFLVSDIYTAIRLSKVGDVNRDGLITIADVPALVNIILEKVKYPDDAENYDFGAADVNCDGNITITDVTSLVNIILNQ